MMRNATLVAACLAMITVAAAAWAGPEPMPASPELLQKLGAKKVAALQSAGLDAKRGGYAMMAEPLRIRPGDKGAKARTSGTGTCLFILWEWTDHAADQANHPAGAYQEMFLSVGSYPMGSMNDFYREASFGAFQIGGEVTGWTTSTSTYASYANPDGSQDPNTCKDMIRDAIAQLDPFVDFAQFDNDGPDGIPDSGDDDGAIDALFFIHAGPGEESTGDPADIWSHAWSFWDLTTNDGVDVTRYSVEPEELPDGTLQSVGVFCHEYGHVLGLPDLYDTDYTSNGIGEWGLMSGGSWNARPGDPAGSCPAQLTAWSKLQLGWVEPVDVVATLTGVTLPPAATNPVAYRIWRDGNPGNEYFLVENRQNVGFDVALTRHQVRYGLEPAHGLLVLHVDDAVSSNSNERHRLVDVEDASPWLMPDGTVRENLDGASPAENRIKVWAFNRSDRGDVWPGFSAANADSTDWLAPRDRVRFADDTVPAATDYACEATGVAIANIAEVGVDVVADLVLTVPEGGATAVAAPAVWDFESSLGAWEPCHAYAHLDQSQAGDCTGSGGLWFGTDGWDNCGGVGYGNDWDDAAKVTVLVGMTSAPEIVLTHRYEVEPGYDYVHVEVRPSVTGAAWTELASFDGASGCRTDTWAIPPAVLDAGQVDGTDNAKLDVRLRLTSDGAWSAEDGSYCGIGWWVDRVEITGAPTAAPESAPQLAGPALLPPVPNPFNPATMVRFHVPDGARDLTLVIFDARGRQVRTLLDRVPGTGWQEVRWDGRDDRGGRAASGLYFVQLRVDREFRVEKMALIK